MKIEITDEMLRKSFRAYQRDGWMRDALEAVAPIIADQVLERAATIADEAAKPYALHTNNGSMTFVGITNKVARAIRALKEPTP